MTKSNKVTIKYNGKDYEIEKKTDEQKVKPKGDDNGTEITIKNYKESSWNHTAEINGETISVKWGMAKKITYIGGPILLVLAFLIIWWFASRKTGEEEKEDE